MHNRLAAVFACNLVYLVAVIGHTSYAKHRAVGGSHLHKVVAIECPFGLYYPHREYAYGLVATHGSNSFIIKKYRTFYESRAVGYPFLDWRYVAYRWFEIGSYHTVGSCYQ